MKKSPRILIYDIETSLMTVTSFSLYPNAIPHTGIIKDWYILCAAWKWLGEKKVHTAVITEVGDDKQVVQELRDAIAEADIIVHHNGDKFDIKKLKARMVFHGIEPFAMPACIDTLKVAKKEFNFTSNRLDYLGRALGCGGKIPNTSGMWDEIARDNISCLPKMVKYNKRDVTLLEEVYLKFRPYMTNHPNLNVFVKPSEEKCPNCGSQNIQKRGFSRTRTTIRQRIQCQDCGAWGQSGKAITTVRVS